MVYNDHSRKYPKGFDTRSRLYTIWRCMYHRCYSKSHCAYERYSKKGIIICSQWKDYKKFMKWALKNGYSEKLIIDRINNKGIYKPSNCRWVTYVESANNKDNSIKITIFGETKSITDWVKDKRCKVKNHRKIWRRIFVSKINPELAIRIKVQRFGHKHTPETIERLRIIAKQRIIKRDENGRFI